MKGTATITTTTTVKPVYITEVKNGEVVQVSAARSSFAAPDGFKMFNQGDIEKRGVTIIKDGEPADITQFHTGDKLTATIVTEGTPKRMTSRQVEATLHPEAGGTMASNASGKQCEQRRQTGVLVDVRQDEYREQARLVFVVVVGFDVRPNPLLAGTKKTLPKTASSLPSVGLVGLGLLMAGAFPHRDAAPDVRSSTFDHQGRPSEAVPFLVAARYSERSACITSTRAARAAGISDARIAAATRTVAALINGSTPGNDTSVRNAPTMRASERGPPADTRHPRRIPAMTAPSRSTPASRCCGVDPIASRTPNSRVRALTENASTPATPTTAMVSATAANPLNTSAFTRLGASTSARTSSRVAACSTG